MHVNRISPTKTFLAGLIVTLSGHLSAVDAQQPAAPPATNPYFLVGAGAPCPCGPNQVPYSGYPNGYGPMYAPGGPPQMWSPSQVYPGQQVPNGQLPGQMTPGQTTPGQTTPGQTTPGQTNQGQDPSTQQLDSQAQNFDFQNQGQDQGANGQDFGDVGAQADASGGVPGTLGDLGGGTLVVGQGFFGGALAGVNLGLAGGDRRFKVIENTSPIPRDRFFVNYNHFHSGLTADNLKSADLDRAVFGIEKTFLQRNYSFEFRLPVVNGVDASAISGDPGPFGPSGSDGDAEVGDIALALKGIMYRDRCTTISYGLSMTIPSGSDSAVIVPHPAAVQIAEFPVQLPGRAELFVDNTSIHLQPFLGFMTRPTQNSWVQTIVQVDIATSGYDFVAIERADVLDPFLITNERAGTIDDMSVLYTGVSFGQWIYRSNCCWHLLQGVAPIFELHYTTSLEDPGTDPTASSDEDQVVQFRDGRYDLLNTSIGLHLDLGHHSSLRLYAGLPLRSKKNAEINEAVVFDGDRFFDAEFALQYNYGY